MDLGVDRPELSVSMAAAAAASTTATAAEDDDAMGAVVDAVRDAEDIDTVDAGDEAAARKRNASDTFSCRESTSLAKDSFTLVVSFSFSFSLSFSFSFALLTLPSFTSFSFSFSFSFSLFSAGAFASFFGLTTAAIAGIGTAGVGRGSNVGLSGGRRRLREGVGGDD